MPVSHSSIFVIGAAKCGTTSLCDYLARSPAVSECLVKEPNFFCKDIHEQIPHAQFNNLQVVTRIDEINKNNSHAAFVTNLKTYEGLFKHGGIRLDGSTNYIFSSTAAEEIFNYDNNAKIIAVLRDPLQRAFSHYVMDVRTGMKVESFERELTKEIEGYERLNWASSPCYLRRSVYFQQLRRFLEIFGHENIKVINFEDMISSNKENTLKDICLFLNIPFMPVSNFEKHNASTDPRSKHLNRILYDMGLKDFARDRIPRFLKSIIKSFFYEESRSAMNRSEVLKVDGIREILIEDYERLKEAGIKLGGGGVI